MKSFTNSSRSPGASLPPPSQQLAQIETDLKSRTAAYSVLKANLENLEKKSTCVLCPLHSLCMSVHVCGGVSVGEIPMAVAPEPGGQMEPCTSNLE